MNNASKTPSEAIGENINAITSDEAAGLVVITQTCDIVRDCVDRPFIEVTPLVAVEPERLEEIARGKRPAFAYIPALADQGLVADLDRVMTIEKSIVASWTRVVGCRTDDEARAFAQALSRKRIRPAFPDDFVAFIDKLQKRIKEKHDRESDEGRKLRALREIRVRATPAWEAEQVDLFFWFIRDSMPGAEQPTYQDLEKWLERVKPQGRFRSVEGQLASLEDLTAQDYVDSDPLDLDYLSTASISESESELLTEVSPELGDHSNSEQNKKRSLLATIVRGFVAMFRRSSR